MRDALRSLLNRAVLTASLALLVGTAPQPCRAGSVDLTPSQDGWVYQFLPGWNMTQLYPDFLPVGNTGPNSPHSQWTFLKFDLAGLGIAGDQVLSATLNLYSADPVVSGFGAAASASHPIQVDAYALAASPTWTSNTLTSPNIPAVIGGVAGSTTIDGVGRWYSIDLTTLVKSWLSGALTNNGLELMQTVEVRDGGSAVIALLPSTRSSTPDLAPSLTITTVPEPASLAMAASALALTAARFRRRRTR